MSEAIAPSAVDRLHYPCVLDLQPHPMGDFFLTPSVRTGRSAPGGPASGLTVAERLDLVVGGADRGELALHDGLELG